MFQLLNFRWKLMRGIIKQMEEMKRLKEESLNIRPGATEGDLWTALIMAEKVGLKMLDCKLLGVV